MNTSVSEAFAFARQHTANKAQGDIMVEMNLVSNRVMNGDFSWASGTLLYAQGQDIEVNVGSRRAIFHVPPRFTTIDKYPLQHFSTQHHYVDGQYYPQPTPPVPGHVELGFTMSELSNSGPNKLYSVTIKWPGRTRRFHGMELGGVVYGDADTADQAEPLCVVSFTHPQFLPAP